MSLNERQRKNSVRALWKEVFQDPEAFMDIYFTYKYSDDVNICVERDNKVVSALQCLSYILPFYSSLIEVGYISGVATLPDYRGRGYAAKIMNEAHKHLFASRAGFSILIPAEKSLFDYYARFGYVTCFYKKQEPLGVTEEKGHLDEVEERTQAYEVAYQFMSEKFAQRPCHLRQSWNDFMAIVEDLQRSGGGLYVGRVRNKIVAMAFLAMDSSQGKAYIKESLGDENYKSDLESYLHRMLTLQKMEVLIVRPALKDEPGAVPYAMARVIDVERVLGLVAQWDIKKIRTIKVGGDDLLLENNGTYTLAGGVCIRGAVNGFQKQYSIIELTEMLLTEQRATLSLMLD